MSSLLPEPIAIIGTGCRFPGAASSPSKLWELLLHTPRNLASKTPSDRFNHDAFYLPGIHHGTSNAPESYFLSENIRQFDGSFFNLSPAEAEAMDPQQRLLLEVVYESLERAGLRTESLQGSDTGVFCGLMNTDYSNLVSNDWDYVPTYTSSGGAASMLANRLSFFFDWHGPSITVDTACSSSLVAMHQAVDALRKGDCPMAIVAASNLILSPREYIAASKLRLLSPTGRCRMWDRDADGYARGEGIAAVVLKPLSAAMRDGDPVECIVRATGVNADGRSLSLTMPSWTAQSRLIQSTYASAGLDPKNHPEDRCQYFEAHGTGTQAGDPQEATALYDAFFDDGTRPKDPLLVGSVKTVIGHTESAAGLAGVIKASLCVQNGVIPPNLFFDHIHPSIAPYTTHLRVPTEALPWPTLAPDVPRRVSVNSFGFGGTNAHVIIESYTPPKQSLPRTPLPPLLPYLFFAATRKSLTDLLHRHIRYLQENPGTDPTALAETLMHNRSLLNHRLILTASSIHDLDSKLQTEVQKCDSEVPTSKSRDACKGIVGIFTGQGAQYPQMCWDLISQSPQALNWMEELQQSLSSLPPAYCPDFLLVEVLSAPKETSRIHEAMISQTLRAAIQIVQVNLLRILGVAFSAVIGHSSGEIAAAYAAGVVSAADAIRLAYLRGWATHHGMKHGGQMGAMLAGAMSWAEAVSLCEESGFSGRIMVAASNSPTSVTFSGDADAVRELEWILQSLNRTARALRVDTAYHSHHMVSCAQAYLCAVRACGIRYHQPNVPWYSTVYSARTLVHDDLCHDYWAENMLRPVRFCEAVRAVFSDSDSASIMVEVGPHPTLQGPVLQTLAEIEHRSPEGSPYLSLAHRESGSFESIANAIGVFCDHQVPKLKVHQLLRMFAPEYERTFLKNLPTYPFDHTRSYWAMSRLTTARLHRTDPPHYLLGALSPETAENEWRWRNFLSRTELEWLNDHKVQSQAVFPAAGYIVMMLEAALRMTRGQSLRLLEIDDMHIKRAINIPDHSQGVEIIFKVEQKPIKNGATPAIFTCYAIIGESLKVCASGRSTLLLGETDPMLLPPQRMPTPATRTINIENFYASLQKLGLDYRGAFRGLQAAARHSIGSTGVVSCNAPSSSILHPAVLDSCLHGMLAAVKLQTPSVPVKIERIVINPMLCRQTLLDQSGDLIVDTVLLEDTVDGARADINTYNREGQGVFLIEGFEVIPLAVPEDRAIFSEIAWGPFMPHAVLNENDTDSKTELNLYCAEHCALLYLRDAWAKLNAMDYEPIDTYRASVMSWIKRVLEMTRSGTHPIYQPEWLDDGIDEVLEMPVDTSSVWYNLRVAGENLPSVLQGSDAQVHSSSHDDFEHGTPYVDPFQSSHGSAEIASFVEQIVFRYPQAKILELNAGGGSTTRSVLNKIGRSYQSYTITDALATWLTGAHERLGGDNNPKLIVRSLSVEEDLAEQGYETDSYDIIIAANSLSQSTRLREAMINIRRLLKPGGYLVAREGTNLDISRVALIHCHAEKWWQSDSDTRQWTPFLASQDWERLLQQTGFGGFEAIAPAGLLDFASTFVSQATDDALQLQRNPWIFSGRLSNDAWIVGGATNASASLASGLEALLNRFFNRVAVVSTLEALDSQELSRAHVLVLTDLDSPCYENLTEERLNGLKALTDNASRLLWVTAGLESQNPYWAMTKGIINCVTYENTQLLSQYLNVPDRTEMTAPDVATIFLRLSHTIGDNDFTLSKRMHSVEPELRLVNGILQIPRFKLNDAMNDRYLAGRRRVCGYTRLHESVIQVVSPSSRRQEFVLSESKSNRKAVCLDIPNHRWIDVTYSTLNAYRVEGAGYLYLIIGHDLSDQTCWFALSRHHASVVSVPLSWCFQIPGSLSGATEPTFLTRMGAAFMAINVLNVGMSDTSVLVHGLEPRSRLSHEAFTTLGLTRGMRVHFTTSNHNTPPNKQALFIYENESARSLSRVLPSDLSVVAQCGGYQTEIFPRITSVISDDVSRVGLKSLYRRLSSVTRLSNLTAVSQTVLSAYGFALREMEPDEAVELIPLCDLHGMHADSSQPAIVDWTTPDRVPVEVQTAGSMVELSPNRTYLLAGMAGSLGQSVCRWMVSRGARFIVLGSRTPQVDPLWIAEMAGLGARVVLVQMDVTSRISVTSTHATLSAELPPIGGVINGAMVLKDQIFTNTNISDVQAVISPKVQGSLLLNEAFGHLDLDFFILFGSAAGPMGNIGQAAYSAATHFMSALIQQRRKQGRVGSIIHPASIAGVGYLSRADSALHDVLERTMGSSSTQLSENDLHELVAEAILAGRVDSGRNADIIAGIEMMDAAKSPEAVWLKNPRAWGFINQSGSLPGETCTRNDALEMKVRLQAAKNIDDVMDIITAEFIREVRFRLNFPAEEPVTSGMVLSEMGVDSLVAIALRQWFAKEVGVDLPMLRFLSGSSIGELAGLAAVRLAKEATAKSEDIELGSALEDSLETSQMAKTSLVEWGSFESNCSSVAV
ncbi:non-reducing polyketide synthase pyr2 [Aspergillus saccharolyticus JOP 1030-1]|uniref:Ketoacyl-synt-domain-containing protein n=1 Tax=Aspergillus saccharolyticus JOP 1030-1 TaxID=1450539 RepID=A0A318ZM32_9EURO|nr:ketoacyl-synt-domain-containing protein [Aspergillus saccharolyticus JOP 1030-1]PYH44900.1 ketoacyl-synt-domain-containing protein [Aspergillus saccharolyticus JOP 1030-1]